MSAFEGGEDRFSLLLLEDGEYYFRDYNCHLWKQADQRYSQMTRSFAESSTDGKQVLRNRFRGLVSANSRPYIGDLASFDQVCVQGGWTAQNLQCIYIFCAKGYP